ncbi:MAG: hypothetical protein FWC70_04945 [Defluviitaleaceae bacterium]|nr:hypothetical protein [Defluviitaleaceae bacterium]
MCKKFFAVLVFIAAIFPVTVYAAQTTRTLQPGNVYEFSGTDARVVSHVNVTGAGRYEIVLRDADGDVTRFGRASGRFSVSGIGAAEITPLAPINVTFDSSRINLQQRPGFALRQIAVRDTLRLENTTNDPLQIRLTGAAGFVFFNRAGDVTSFVSGDPDELLPMLTIPARSAVKLETVGDAPLAVYFPSRWYGREVLAEFLGTPAVARILLTEPLTLTARENNFALRLVGADADTPLSYEYVIRGRDGHVIRYGDTEGRELSLAARQTLTITPLEPGYIYFPYVWLDEFEIENNAVAPVHVSLRPGESLEIVNSDPLRDHTIFIRCSDDTGVEFGFEYVMHYDDEISFDAIDDFLAAQASVTIPAGAVVTLTATQADEILAISVPDVPAITTRYVTATALIRREISPGETVRVANDGDDAEKILIRTDSRTDSNESVDFVLYDEDGEIYSFGRIDGHILLDEAQSVLLTATDCPATLIFPRGSQVTVEESERAALVRRELSYGEYLQITNNDRRLNRAVMVQNESERDADGYDFIVTDANNNVSNYGVASFGLHVLPYTRRLTIAPQRGSTISVSFPAEQSQHFRFREVNTPPLHRITVAPGNSVSFNNRTERDFAISNNSRPGGAGFHTLGEGEYERFYEADRTQYFYVFRQPPPIDIHNDTPRTGDMLLAAGERRSFTAALGEELEIIMPRAWARTLGLVR